MGAFAGMVHLDGRLADRSELKRMIEALAHRGSGEPSLWCGGPAGLASFALEQSSFVLASDSRVDEPILSVFERWGERCPEHLVGDFAFALWDERKRRLFCARDPFGVKPFFYCLTKDRFAFASTIRPLLKGISHTLNERRLADYMAMALEDPEETFYQGIQRLPPGHWLWVDERGLRIRRYWSAEAIAERESDPEAFLEVFSKAVESSLRNASSVGVTLSGGLDSSSVVCVARKLMGEDSASRLHTLSVVSQSDEERPYIKAIVEQGGVIPHELPLDALNPVGDLDRVLWHIEEPFFPPYHYIFLASFEAARRNSLPVVLDGHCGDTAVSYAFSYLAELARSGDWIEFMELAGSLARTSRIPLGQLLKRLAPKMFASAWRTLRGRDEFQKFPLGLINPDFARRMELRGRLRTLKARCSVPAATVREEHARGFHGGELALSLEVLDKLAAASGVDLRHPFLDRRVVEFCLALSGHRRFYRGRSRGIVRRALRDLLPEKVCLRGWKTNHGLLLDRAMRVYGRALLREVLFEDPEAVRPFVNLAAYQDLFRRFYDAGMRGAGMDLWRVAVLATWLRTTVAQHG